MPISTSNYYYIGNRKTAKEFQKSSQRWGGKQGLKAANGNSQVKNNIKVHLLKETKHWWLKRVEWLEQRILMITN